LRSKDNAAATGEWRRAAARLLPALVLVAATGCEWLLKLDRTPPTCVITSPADSAVVSGRVRVRAEAYDSVALDRVDFYADGVWFGTDSNVQATATWDVTSLPSQSWHRLFCVALDLAGNAGYSETISVQVVEASQRSVYHGTLRVPRNGYVAVRFEAREGDTLAGEARDATGGLISRFMWLDNANYLQFWQGGTYSTLFELAGVSELSLRQAVPGEGAYSLVFVNERSYEQTYWARFVLE